MKLVDLEIRRQEGLIIKSLNNRHEKGVDSAALTTLRSNPTPKEELTP